MHATTVLELDLGALRDNYGEVSRLAGDRRVIGAIKADGYGFGAAAVARELDACGAYGVWTGNPEEAIALRGAGATGRIIMFGGCLPGRIGELVEHSLIPTVHDVDGLATAARVGEQRGEPTAVYLKVDCGLRRLGVPVARAAAVARTIGADRWLRLEGLYTHLPFGDAEGGEWALQRSFAFRDLLHELSRVGVTPKVTQLWGSSGLRSALPDPSNAVCVGQLLYGFSPVADSDPLPGTFRSVIASLTTRIIHIGDHTDPNAAPASAYSFGTSARVGVVPVGTADGMRAGWRGRAMHVLVRDRPVPIIGVTLEHVMVDLDGLDHADVGDEVVLIGASANHEVTLAEWADWFGCSQLEVAVSFLNRLPKRYRGATVIRG